MLVLCGGLRGLRGPCVASIQSWWGGVDEGSTYTQKLESFESLPWYDSDELHFAYKRNLRGR